MKWFLICLAAMALAVAHATTRFPGQWNSVPAEVREWYRTQMVPGGSSPCCSAADSTSAQEDRRLGHDGNVHYWAKFNACGTFNDGKGGVSQQCIPVDWTEVPDQAVLKGYRPPRNVQLPVVWWFWDGQNWGIRCYAPEPDA